MRTSAPVTTLFVVAALSTATLVNATPSASTTEPVIGILHSFGAHSQGWGHVRPHVLYNGGDGSGDITLITWSSWGGATARGIGKNSIFSPKGGYYRRPVNIQLRATDVGPCGSTGRPGYHHLYVREPSRPGGPYGKWRIWTSYHRDLCKKFNPTGIGSGATRESAAPAASTIPVPQQDHFYSAPAGYADKPLGAILRSRPVQLATFAALPQKVQAWQVLFRSTDDAGKPTVAVTTLLRPAGVQPKAVISYQVAEDASAPQCAPSYVMRPAAAPGEAVNQAEIAIIDAAVADGFAVSMPDYEGVGGDFGAARQPGYIELDGLRAAEHFAPLGLTAGKRTPVALWGYSGGSLASGWGAQLQPHYAPDLDLTGVAVGGFVTNVEQALVKINGGPAAGLVPSALPGVLRSTPRLAKAISPYLTAPGKALLAKSGSQCEIANVTQYPFFNVDDYLTIPLSTLLTRPAVKHAINSLNLGGSTPKAPLFVYHAINDELIPVAGPDAMVPRYCKAGDSVTYTRDELSEHGALAVTGAAAALSWLHARLTGAPKPHGCTTTTVPTMALTPTALAQEPELVTSILSSLIGLPVGPAPL